MSKETDQTAAEKAQVLTDYKDDSMTTSEIAAKHDLSLSTITVRARKAGLRLRGQGRWMREVPTPRQIDILRMATVKSYEDTGRRFGMHKQSIHRIMKRWKGYPLNPPVPFARGDIVVWSRKRFVVIEASAEEGTLIDTQGKVYRNFMWNGGRVPKKVGVDERYVTTGGNGQP